MQFTAKEIAKALSNGKETRLGEGQWKSLCPAHNDSTPSMTITDGKSGKILVRCHKGCSGDDIIKALKDRGLWDEYNPKSRHKTIWTPLSTVPSTVKDPGPDLKHHKHGTPVKRWTYLNADREVIGYIYRFETPGGKVPVPLVYCVDDNRDEPKKDWRWQSFEKPRPIYGLELLKERPNDKVAIFEGEKACDAARKLFSEYVCIAWPGGGKACKYVDWSPLKGRDVTIWPDADKPGTKAVNDISEIMISEMGQKPKIVQLPPDLETVSEGWDVADEIPAGVKMDLKDMLATAIEYEPVGQSILSNMNKKYAFILIGGKGTVLREFKDSDGLDNHEVLSVEGFKQMYSNVQVPVGRNYMELGTYWMKSPERRSYYGITFDPVRDRREYYNLWKGYSVEPDESGDWSIFRQHLFENAASGNEEHFNWILGWFAQMFQFPGHKVGTSLSFRGKQGTGKTVIGWHMGQLIKQHYTLVDDTRLVFGNFNAHMARTLLLHSDEGFFGGDPKHIGKIKSMVTSETQMIEYKGRDPIPVKNYMRLLITTNQNWVVPAASEERRFAVFDMGEGKKQDKSYFIEMERQMRQGGYAAMLHDLLCFDLDKVNIGVIPVTAALRDQKTISMSNTSQFWYECLLTGEILKGSGLGWMQQPICNALYEKFIEEVRMWGPKYPGTQNDFFTELKTLLPDHPNRFRRKAVGSKSEWCFDVPDLDTCRRYFDTINNTQFAYLGSSVPDPIQGPEAPEFPDQEDDIPF